MSYNILLMGASYGSLLASKLLFGGHKIHLVCLPPEAELINAEGFRVRMPVRGRKEPVVLDSRNLPGKVTAGGAAGVDPKQYDLVGLCMQEPQYRSPGVRELLDAVAKSRVPCMSIMNMPPLPYVKRIPGLDYEALRPAYTDPTVWDAFDPAFMTLNSPDPQAIRPPEEKVNVLMVTLPTNFKVAKFDNDKHTAILRQLEKDVEAARFDTPEGKIELPVKLKVHDSIFVPLAKWAMLLAGNYRCITKDGMRTAQEAVHTDIETSRSVYNFVNDLCVKLGANPGDLVPFEKYAAAAQSLVRPASAARALNNGVPNIERADKLVQLIAKQKGLSHPVIDATVALVELAAGGQPQEGGVNTIVIPGLVPGIDPSACFGADRSLDPGNECRDDGLTRRAQAPDLHEFSFGLVEGGLDGLAEAVGALDGFRQLALHGGGVDPFGDCLFHPPLTRTLGVRFRRACRTPRGSGMVRPG